MDASEILEGLKEQTLGRQLGRREYLAFCGKMAALLGLSSSMVPRIAAAIESNQKTRRAPVVWLEFQDCAGNTESFTRASAPSVGEALLGAISLDYHEVLMAAAGHQAEEARRQTLEAHKGELLVVVEGSIPLGADGAYCTVAGRSAEDILLEMQDYAKAFVAVGTCATFGGLPKASPNPTGAVAVEDLVRKKPVINLPGCPANPDTIMALLVHYLTFDRLPELDHEKRPTFAYGKRIHDTCERRAHYDAGQFALGFDDFGANSGWCLYYLGCKGPETYNVCASWKWNEGADWPVGAGHPCIGCSERDFWDRFTPFYGRLPRVRGFGIEATADQVGVAAMGAAAAGAVGHAAYTGFVKMTQVKREPGGEPAEEPSNESSDQS